MIPALIKAGADVNERNNPNKVTVFMIAAYKINCVRRQSEANKGKMPGCT